jgi:hypothetical protein
MPGENRLLPFLQAFSKSGIVKNASHFPMVSGF